MRSELGPDWEASFAEFERIPVASASIGQVHKAKVASSNLPVAVKVQFPGIASSITSDLDNLSILLKTSALLPRGLYLDNTLAVMRGELADECDYLKEAESGRRFRVLLKDDELFEVPEVVDELCTSRILTTEMMSGRPLSEIKHLSQETRDKVRLSRDPGVIRTVTDTCPLPCDV
jgi:aarF domain-containing kinase